MENMKFTGNNGYYKKNNDHPYTFSVYKQRQHKRILNKLSKPMKIEYRLYSIEELEKMYPHLK